MSVKTEILQRQQQVLFEKEEKRNKINRCILYTIGIYFIFFAVYCVGKYYFEIWNTSVILAEFLIATTISIFTCVKSMGGKK